MAVVNKNHLQPPHKNVRSLNLVVHCIPQKVFPSGECGAMKVKESEWHLYTKVMHQVPSANKSTKCVCQQQTF